MIGDKLKQLREQRDYSQGYVADTLGISRVNYNRYENNNREPDGETLKRIADFFNVSTDELLGREIPVKNEPEKVSARDQRDLDKFLEQSEVMFDGELHQLDDEGREMLRDALKYAFWQAKEKISANLKKNRLALC